MDGRVEAESLGWVEEYDGQLCPPLTSVKRKVRSKKLEFFGWGSKPLIEFLQSIGKDTTQKISQFDVTDIITKYVNENNLFHPQRRKRILCDERLLSLFGRKTISRNKIYDMLETHYAENHDESDDGFLDSSEEKNDLTSCEKQKSKKTTKKRKLVETPKSCFAAIIPDNIKLVYLKKSLVQDLLKDPETLEHKILGSFVRIKSDPNDYLQKNSHRLLQVTGLKEVSRTDNTSAEILLQASDYIKDIQISTLSDDDFSEEECEDLQQRVKDGLLKRPTVVELEEKAQILHEDITKHWLVGELALLQKLIDRANEKGWRRELFEYLERRQLLQTPAEQSRLLHEIPKVIADDIEQVVTAQDMPDDMKQGNDDSLVQILREASNVPISEIAANGTLTSFSTDSAGIKSTMPGSKQQTEMENELNVSFQKQQKLPTHKVRIEENKNAQVMTEKQVIDLSDDDDNDEEEQPSGGVEVSDTGMGRLEWHYADPQGDIQGPFSITSLKRWKDSDYFTPDFKVWKTGQTQDDAVLLRDILQWVFP